MSGTELSLQEVLEAGEIVVPPGCTLHVSADASGQPVSISIKDGEGNDVVVGWRSVRKGVVHHPKRDGSGRLYIIDEDLAGWQIYRTKYYPN